MDENSAQDTSIGQLSSLDQDASQNHSYVMLDSAGGRFKVDTNAVKVRHTAGVLFDSLHRSSTAVFFFNEIAVVEG